MFCSDNDGSSGMEWYGFSVCERFLGIFWLEGWLGPCGEQGVVNSLVVQSRIDLAFLV